MLTITPPIEKFSAVKNPVNWRACTDIDTSIAGAKAQVILRLGNTNPVDGDTFTFYLRGQSFTFSFVTAPVGCNQLNAGAVNYAQLQTAVKAQRFIDLYYDVRILNGELEITAKANGADDSVELFVTSNTNVIYHYSSTAGADDVYRDFSILADISTEDGLIGTVSGTPVASCNTFNLEEYLRSIVQYSAPEVGGSHKIAEGVVMPYTLTCWEQYDGNICGKTVNDTRVAWLGGTLNEIDDFGATVLFFEPDAMEPFDRRFLTNRPKESLHHMLNLNWLYWYTTASSVTMHYQITYANGATQTLTKVVAIASVNQVYAYRCDLEYWRLNALSQPAEKVVRADFWLSTATEVSETRTFVRDDESNPFIRHFAFVNSLGGIDFFTTKNYMQKGVKVDSYTTLNSSHANSKTAEMYQEEYKVGTGCITQATANWLQDLIISDKVYIYVGGQWLPIIITDSEKVLWRDKQGYYEIQLECRMSYDNKAVDHRQILL
jgi:hypothetical protein